MVEIQNHLTAEIQNFAPLPTSIKASAVPFGQFFSGAFSGQHEIVALVTIKDPEARAGG